MDADKEKEGIRNPLRRNLKDSVFSDLFSEEWYAAELARELVPEIPEGTPVNVTNAGGVISPGPIHDLVLIAGSYAIMAVEAQSTKNPNMPIRIMLYQAEVLIAMTRRYNVELLSRNHAEIPRLLAFVIYTGKEKVPDVMRLSDSYPGRMPTNNGIEVTVRVIHAGNAPKGSKVGEYIMFSQIADGCREEAEGDMNLYAHLLKERCEKANILQEYLKVKWVEVMGYYEEIFNQEAANRAMRKDAREEGRIEGRIEGRKEGLAEGLEKGRAETTEKERTEFAVRLLADGMAPEKVAELSKLSIEEVRALMDSPTS